MTARHGSPPPGGGWHGPPPGPGTNGAGRPGDIPGSASAKPITGGPNTMALHAMTLDPTTGLPKGEAPPSSTAAVLSFVCGVLLCLGPLTGVPAIITGVVARKLARDDPARVGGGTLAVAGIVLGFCNLGISAVVAVLVLLRLLL